MSFNYGNIETVQSNFELDNCLIGTTAEAACIIKIDDWKTGTPVYWDDLNFISTSKPIGAYLVYVAKSYIPNGQSKSHQFEKKKGFHDTFGINIEITRSVGFNIELCDASLSVTTGFTYEHGISEETTESWTESVTGPAECYTYQSVIVYATAILDTPNARNALNLLLKDHEYFARNGYLIFFTTVFRNTPQTLNKGIEPVSQDTFFSYLQNEGFSKWYSEFKMQIGHLRHGSQMYMLEQDSSGNGGNGDPVRLWSNYHSATKMGDEFNKFILTPDGYLYHVGSGRFVIAKDSSGNASDGTLLILWNNYHSQTDAGDKYNTYTLTPEGHLIHNGSGLYIIGRDSSQSGGFQDGNVLILYHNYHSQTILGDEFNTFRFVK